jgi:hypothetical protein
MAREQLEKQQEEENAHFSARNEEMRRESTHLFFLYGIREMTFVRGADSIDRRFSRLFTSNMFATIHKLYFRDYLQAIFSRLFTGNIFATFYKQCFRDFLQAIFSRLFIYKKAFVFYRNSFAGTSSALVRSFTCVSGSEESVFILCRLKASAVASKSD